MIYCLDLYGHDYRIVRRKATRYRVQCARCLLVDRFWYRW